MKNTQTDKANRVIRVSPETHANLMLFKIRCNAKNLDEALKQVIKKLRGEAWKAK